MLNYIQALDQVRGQQTKGDALEVIAILANSQRIDSATEEKLQDWVEEKFCGK